MPISPSKFSLSELFYPTLASKGALEKVNLLLQHGWTANYCHALPILGPPGCGKTHFIQQYPKIYEEENGRKLRSLYVEVKATSNLRSFVATILKDAGDPDHQSGTADVKTDRLYALMEGNYDVLFLDEFQRLIDKKTEKVLQDIADWVAGFLNKKICPVVFGGELKTERVFRSNAHFEGRTFATYRMGPYRWSVKQERFEYLTILGAFEAYVNFPRPSNLIDRDMAIRIHYFSKGFLRQTSLLIQIAATKAFEENSPMISVAHFAYAADSIRISMEAGRQNPFGVNEAEYFAKAVAADELQQKLAA